jgi:hypothetical protein
MRLDIQGSAMAEIPTVRRHAEQRALFELARYGDGIQDVRLRVSERPATAEHRYHCGVAITMRHDDGTARHVLSRAEGDNVFRLLDTVIARAASLAGGEIERALAAREARNQWLAVAAAGH